MKRFKKVDTEMLILQVVWCKCMYSSDLNMTSYMDGRRA